MATRASVPVITLRNVSKLFGGKPAINGIDLDVRQGEVFGFLGPNGAGKSTTIRLLLDILRPDSGTIQLLGRPNRETHELHREIGFLSGDLVMDPDLTGLQYLKFVNNLHGGRYADTITRLSELLDADTSKKIGDYSRGNRQKIGLIASLLPNPKVLILDEPTSGFDPIIQERFATLIREYVSGGGTVFMSSHILAEVQNLCDRVAFIREGRIISTSSVHELLDSNAKRVEIAAPVAALRAVRKDYGNLSGLALTESTDKRLVFTYSGDIPPLLKFFAGKKLTDITIREPELEEIFGRYYETWPDGQISGTTTPEDSRAA